MMIHFEGFKLMCVLIGKIILFPQIEAVLKEGASGNSVSKNKDANKCRNELLI